MRNQFLFGMCSGVWLGNVAIHTVQGHYGAAVASLAASIAFIYLGTLNAGAQPRS